MGTKTVAVSTDDITYNTLPGNSGELNNEAGAIDDTIFGQAYKSSETGLINWGVKAPAFFKGYAGYLAKIKKQGTSTVMTTEAMTLVSGKTYKITNTAKNVWNNTVAPTVFDNGVNQTANVLSINYLFGQITFKASYTPTGPVTVTGAYYPTVTLGSTMSYTLTQTAEAVENTAFDVAQSNGGYRTYTGGLKTVSLELGGFYNISSALRAALQARGTFLIEIDPSGTGKSVARGFFKLLKDDQSGDVGALEEESVNFELQVPASDYVPYGWMHDATTTLHTSIQQTLAAWENSTSINVKYLYDGTNGIKGSAIVTDVTLSSGLDNMNEFQASFQGSGAQTVVGTG